MSQIKQIDILRRKFVKQSATIGGGLTLGFYMPFVLGKNSSATQHPLAPSAKPAASEINAWVIVRPDNTVTIRYARSEMGQGSSTAAPMMVAEELECDWKQVRMEYASPNENIRRKHIWGKHDGRRQLHHPHFAGVSAQSRCQCA